MASPIVQIRVKPELRDEWMAEATARRISLSEMVRDAVELYLAQVPRPPAPDVDALTEKGKQQMRDFFTSKGIV